MSNHVRFGYLFDFRNPEQWRRPWHEHYAEHLEFISWTETIGFEGVWLAEHHGVVEDGYNPSPLMMAQAIAVRTKTLRIATGIALAPFYHPVRLAEETAILDIVSNGRLDLALAVGFRSVEAAAYGVDFKTRGKRMNEMVQIIPRLWAGETVTFDGEFFQLNNCRLAPLPLQKPMPLFIGGVTKPALVRAAKYGTGFSGPIEHYAVYAEALRELGKDPADARVHTMGSDDIYIMVSEDPEKTLDEVAPHMLYNISSYARMWAAEGTSHPGTIKAEDEMDLATFKKQGLFKVFTPDEAIAHIKKRRELGPFESYCMMAPPGLPLKKLAEHAELFANKVMPAFR
jgi:alkanesulfonate monooxygenase SsuD/methylene tetrahydromethanopterin reductase-like flavin-dependent oxidoreductase (luciferase family)